MRNILGGSTKDEGTALLYFHNQPGWTINTCPSIGVIRGIGIS